MEHWHIEYKGGVEEKWLAYPGMEEQYNVMLHTKDVITTMGYTTRATHCVSCNKYPLPMTEFRRMVERQPNNSTAVYVLLNGEIHHIKAISNLDNQIQIRVEKAT